MVIVVFIILNNSMKDKITSRIIEHISAAETLLTLQDEIQQVAQTMIDTLKMGNTIYWIGNGGSAADCQHLSAELVGSFLNHYNHLPSVALTTDTSALTSIANDIGFDKIFSVQIKAICKPGDLVIGMSTSGESTNVEMGLSVATTLGLKTIAFLGGDGGYIRNVAQTSLVVPVQDTGRVQECHILLGHIICEIIDNETRRISHKSKAIYW